MVKNPLKWRAMGGCFLWAALAGEGGMVYGKPWWQDEKNAGNRLIASSTTRSNATTTNKIPFIKGRYLHKACHYKIAAHLY